MQIEEKEAYRFSLLHLGFRPFFLLGAIFSVILVGLWLWILSYGGWLATTELSVHQWHAHEMLYGYTYAVIAGFLLTATRNWTGINTLNGIPLLLLALFWLFARAMPFIDHPQSMFIMSILDIIFNLGLATAILVPIIKVRQWKHLAIWSKVAFLLVGNVLFYFGLFNFLDNGIQIGIYTGFYIIISLIMLMGRRVIPFFIEKSAGETSVVNNYRWIDITSLFLMLVFIVVEVFFVMYGWATFIAVLLAVVHGVRLWGWYTNNIWKTPLVWVLYLGYMWIVVGFILRALAGWFDINPMLAIHAFAYGGIGMVTIGMMARVALGHTGRDVFNPPRSLTIMFALIFAGSVVRVMFPLFLPDNTSTWIFTSQLLWIIAFAEFVFIYTSMLIKPRVDGKFG